MKRKHKLKKKESGKALTENETVCKIHEHNYVQQKKKKSLHRKSLAKTFNIKNRTRKNSNLSSVPQPGPSGLSKNIKTSSNLRTRMSPILV